MKNSLFFVLLAAIVSFDSITMLTSNVTVCCEEKTVPRKKKKFRAKRKVKNEPIKVGATQGSAHVNFKIPETQSSAVVCPRLGDTEMSNTGGQSSWGNEGEKKEEDNSVYDFSELQHALTISLAGTSFTVEVVKEGSSDEEFGDHDDDDEIIALMRDITGKSE